MPRTPIHWLPLAAALLAWPSASRADELTPGGTLRMTFKVDNHFLNNLEPDTILLILHSYFIAAPIGSYTATLNDGGNLLGSHSSTLLGSITGPFNASLFSEWATPSSLYTLDSPTIIDFTPILDGTIQGVMEFTISTGSIDVDLNNVELLEVHAMDGSSGSIVSPAPLVTSVSLGSFTNYCFANGGLATACPCGHNVHAERGCENSWFTGGAYLAASGSPALDTVTLTSTEELPSALSIFLQGDVSIASGVAFGDGVRCIGGNLKRLYSKNAHGGTATAPNPGSPSIKAQSAALGDPIPPGATRFYQVYYRDPNTGWCVSPDGDSWNVGNAVAIAW